MVDDEELIREMYARFGLAYYISEVLHRSLCNLVALRTTPQSSTRLRFEEQLRWTYSLTLGQVIREASGTLPESTNAELEIVRERRNFLAHHFWYERAHLMMSAAGVRQMIAEVNLQHDLFRIMNEEIDALEQDARRAFGIDDAVFEAALAGCLAGEAPEPFSKRRRPSKRERVVAAFLHPREQGGHAVVFETVDGELWTLAHDGFAWFETAAPELLIRCDEIQAILPADFAPRPKTLTAPWNYDLPIGQEMRLEVRPGEAGAYRYVLRR